MKQILTIALLLAFVSTQGQDQFSAFEKRTFIRNGDTLLYRILLPLNYPKGKKYPVILFLHGSGERGNDNTAQLVHGGSLFMDSTVRQKYPAIVVFPQCPSGTSWVGYKAKQDSTGKRMLALEEGTPIQRSLELTKLLMDSLAGSKRVNKHRLYVGGLSMGGFGTFDLLQRYPSYFAAAFPICGGGRPEDATKYAKQLPLWIFHGGADDVVNPDWSRNIVAALKQAGVNVKYTEYPGVKHNSWDNAFAEPDLLPWLMAQSRK